MHLKSLLFLLTISVYSCVSSNTSEQLLEDALFIYYESELENQVKIDSSLVLINQALQLNNQSFKAHSHKRNLQFEKRDLNGHLTTTEKLIELRPDVPELLGSKAFLLELSGDTLKAKKLYQDALFMYEEYLQEDSLDFNLNIGYSGMLHMSGDTTSANAVLEKMEKSVSEDWQKMSIKAYRKDVITKKTLIKYWNGEIEYGEL